MALHKGKYIMKELTQAEKLYVAFTTGRELTTKQITAQYRIASPRKVISRLRNDNGLNITSTLFTNSRGKVSQKYRLAA